MKAYRRVLQAGIAIAMLGCATLAQAVIIGAPPTGNNFSRFAGGKAPLGKCLANQTISKDSAAEYAWNPTLTIIPACATASISSGVAPVVAAR